MNPRTLLPTLILALAPLVGPAKDFAGTITYEQKAKGGPNEAAFALAASKITVHIGKGGYRQDENGGLNEGSVIIRPGARTALRLNHKKKTSPSPSYLRNCLCFARA